MLCHYFGLSLTETKAEIQYQSQLTRATLMRHNLEISESTFPTSFIILKEKINKADTSDVKCEKIVNTVMDYATGLSRVMDQNASRMDKIKDMFEHLRTKLKYLFLWDKESAMWLYVVDEANFEPLSVGKFLIEIQKPHELAPKLLPLMQTTLYLAAIYGSTAGVLRMFGYPLPTIPNAAIEMGKDSVKLLQKSSTVEQHKLLQNACAEAKQSGDSSSSQNHTMVRGYLKDELESFYREHGLIDNNGKRVDGAFGKLEQRFTQLRVKSSGQ